MSQNVRVVSIATIEDFRNALILFMEDAKAALGSVEMEVRRTSDWLIREQSAHWTAEVKRGSLAVSEAQAALFRRKLQQRPGSPPNDSEQKELLRVAKRRLEHAEEKLKVVKKWIPVFQRAVSEYHSRAHPLGDSIEGDLRNAVAKLDRMVAALDAYTKIAPPSMAAMAPSGVGGGPGTKAAASPGGATLGMAVSEGEAPAPEAAAVEGGDEKLDPTADGPAEEDAS